MENLLLEIAKCPNFITGAVVGNPCYEILSCQAGHIRQVPEPWNGNIKTAKILFLSSNPSIGQNEMYPSFDDKEGSLTGDWNDDKVSNYFINRFSKEHPYTKNYLYPQHIGGEYMSSWVRFWAAVRTIAKVILEKTVTPGDDYALVEIVRCKSKEERGVDAATNECVNRYLDSTISLSSAKIIICLGKKVEFAIRKKYNISSIDNMNGENKIEEIQINDRKIMLLFLPHPNARQKRNLFALFNEEQLKIIRSVLS